MSAFKLAVTVLFAAVLFIPQATFAIGLEVAVGGWLQNPGGDIQHLGDSLNFDDDLKFDSEIKFFGRAKIDTPFFIPNVYVMVSPVMEFGGTGNKNISFDFAGKAYSANLDFTSKLKLDQYDIALYFGIPGLSLATLGTLNIDLGINTKIVDFSAEIKQGNTSESISYTLPVPMAYAALQLKIPKLPVSLEEEIRGIGYGGDYYIDSITRIKADVFKPVFIAVGYKYQTLNVDYKSVNVDITFSGVFAEVGVSF